MAIELWRRRPVLVPPGFRLWAAFMVVVLFSVVTLSVDAPETVGTGGFGSYLVFLSRAATYLALTVLLVYVGNLTERELPRLALIRMLGFLCIVTIAGGVLGTVVPRLHFTSVTEMLMPGPLRSNGYVRDLVHPRVAQNQDILGATSPRPSAPYVYTNDWGNALSVLLIWFTVGWAVHASTLRRIGYAALIAVAAVPIVYSLNRGLWLAIGFSVAYVAVRLAIRRRTAALRVLAIGLVLGSIVFVASPLSNIVAQRAETPHSNEGRMTLFEEAVRLGLSSPIVGYGGTRDTVGSSRSIAIGPSPECPRCGELVIGSAGQITLILVSQGLLGAVLFVGFFVYTIWYHRDDHSTIGIAGGLSMTLPLLLMFIYNAIGIPLAVTLLSAALLWRNSRLREETAAVGHPAPA